MNEKKEEIKKNLIFVLLCITFVLSCILSDIINFYIGSSLIFYLFNILPILSIIWGMKNKSKFIIVLSIIFLLLSIWQIFLLRGFGYSINKNKVDNYMITDMISKDIDFILPKKGTVIEIYDILSCNNKNIIKLYNDTSDENALILDRKDARQFVNSIKKSDKWVSKLDKTNKSLVDGIVNKKNNKNIYHLIYIKETNSFNKMPYEKGEYNVYYLRYEVKSRMLRIYKYCYYVN